MSDFCTDRRTGDRIDTTGQPGERRIAPRYPFPYRVQYRHTTMRDARALDLSDAGMAVVTDEVMAPDSELELFLIKGNVFLSGRVVSQVPLPEGGLRTGLRFHKSEGALVELLLALQPRLDP